MRRVKDNAPYPQASGPDLSQLDLRVNAFIWPDYPVVNDPARPVWHFGPPAQWMNDPNGTAWHDGWFHVFYQHNPGGDEWGDIHWGHTRSRDLVHWEHLPLALRPRHADGEKHCYSGCLALTATGEPRILYTSVPADSARPATQVLAIPDDSDWRAWTQQVGTPFLDLATHGGPAFDFDRKWRDPFVFRAEGRTFLILGATLGTEAVIPLYENPDGGLRHWVYRGIIHRAPRTETPFFECANLIRFGSKWLLITSPCREVEWCSGTLDLGAPAFRAGPRGRVDEGDGFYATQFVRDPAGRTVLFGWVRNFPKQRGWNGCLAAPRRVWLDAAGCLCAEPVAELAALRSAEKVFPALSLGPAPTSLDLPGDHLHEVELTLERDPAATVRCEIAGVVIAIGPDGVRFNDRPPVAHATGEANGLAVARVSRPVNENHRDKHGSGDPCHIADRVHWLFDRSMIEIFVGERAVYTRVVPFPSSPVAQLTASGGYARLLAARAWALRPAPPVMGF